MKLPSLSLSPKPFRLTLAWQFVAMGMVVLLIGMALIGLWVSASVERAILQNRADATALFVDGLVSTLSQDLSFQETLGLDAQNALAEAIRSGPLAARVSSFKIWSDDGTVAFSSDRELIGRRFDPQPALREALDGQVTAEYDPLEGEEHAAERATGHAYLEIHSPIRDAKTGNVIGAVEFYERSDDILQEIADARQHSWLVVAAVTVGMLALLFVIVARGSMQIENQRRRLDDQLQELSELLATNTALRDRAEEAAQRTVALNERYLRRISADLHDGPTQLLSFAILRLEAMRKGAARADDEELVRRSITEAMDEIRSLCRDLRLPELEDLSGRDVAVRAIQSHEFHSGVKVHSDIADIGVATHGAKVCLFRFLQETLSNAARHAGAANIHARARQNGAGIVVSVDDDGVGYAPDPENPGLGLAGLAERIASLGGRMKITASPHGGTSVEMILP